MPTALNNGRRSRKKVLRAVVARLLGRKHRHAMMRRLVTGAIVLLVGGVAAAAILAAIVNNESPSRAEAVGSHSRADVSLCDVRQLELSIRASGFASHVAALRLSGAELCDVGQLHVTAAVVGQNGQRVPTQVAPPQEFAGQIHPGEELIATFDYTTPCRQKGPFLATVIAAGEVGSVRETAPVTFRRDPFTTPLCKAP